METWSDLEKDSLTELVNMGMGQAASALSELVRDEVLLTAPELQFVDREGALKILQPEDNFDIVGIRQSFSGPFSGIASLIFPHLNSLDIVNLILGEDLPPDILVQMEQEAMTEIGNIILNACLATLANHLSIELDTHLPDFARGSVNSLLRDSADESDNYILCRVLFSISASKMEGHVFFMIGKDSVENLHLAIQQFIKDMM